MDNHFPNAADLLSSVPDEPLRQKGLARVFREWAVLNPRAVDYAQTLFSGRDGDVALAAAAEGRGMAGDSTRALRAALRVSPGRPRQMAIANVLVALNDAA
jgi:hypothetical protein